MARTFHDGQKELRAARSAGWHLLLSVAAFSAAVNLLNLVGPLFMMQVYDRVLGSRSVETLAALFGVVAFLFVMMGLLDLARTRVMARIAARFHAQMEGRVFRAALQDGAATGQAAATAVGPADLDAVQRLIASPVMLALFDLPWVPMFLAGLFIFHPLLGAMACLGGLVLVITTLLNQLMSRDPLRQAHMAGQQADRTAAMYREEGELIGALGMRGATQTRWQRLRDDVADATMRGADRSSGFTVFSRVFRLFLQSALLAAGAWLVLRGEVTPGAMIASSVLMGRTLAPIEQIVGGWPLVQRGQDGWRRLGELLSRRPPPRRCRFRWPRDRARRVCPGGRACSAG